MNEPSHYLECKMARLFIFANLFVATLSTAAYEKNLNTYIEERQKLIAEENDNFLGTVWNLTYVE